MQENTRRAEWQADWGNGISAIARETPCTVKQFKEQGYQFLLSVDIPAARVRKQGDAYQIAGDRAETVKGCWFRKDDGLVHAKMIRKKDGKQWEQDLNFSDGSWQVKALSDKSKPLAEAERNTKPDVIGQKAKPESDDMPTCAKHDDGQCRYPKQDPWCAAQHLAPFAYNCKAREQDYLADQRSEQEKREVAEHARREATATLRKRIPCDIAIFTGEAIGVVGTKWVGDDSIAGMQDRAEADGLRCMTGGLYPGACAGYYVGVMQPVRVLSVSRPEPDGPDLVLINAKVDLSSGSQLVSLLTVPSNLLCREMESPTTPSLQPVPAAPTASPAPAGK